MNAKKKMIGPWLVVGAVVAGTGLLAGMFEIGCGPGGDPVGETTEHYCENEQGELHYPAEGWGCVQCWQIVLATDADGYYATNAAGDWVVKAKVQVDMCECTNAYLDAGACDASAP